MATNQGIDYAGRFSTVNRDSETGIRYGVISTHSLHEWLWDSIESDYGEATCPDCGNTAVDACATEIQSADWAQELTGEWACPRCETCFESDNAYPEEALGWSIDDGEYKVIDCLDSDAMVIKAPYFTYAHFCSPCVPGACSIESPIDAADISADTVKSYCFGHDWFDGGRAPYPVYSVESGELVPAPATEVQS